MTFLYLWRFNAFISSSKSHLTTSCQNIRPVRIALHLPACDNKATTTMESSNVQRFINHNLFCMFLTVFFSTSLLCLVSIRFHFLTCCDVNYYNCKWMETMDMLTKIFLSSTFLSRIIVPWSFLLKTFSKSNSTFYEIWYAVIAPSIFLFINLLIWDPYFVLVKQLCISLRIFAKNLKAFSFANIL